MESWLLLVPFVMSQREWLHPKVLQPGPLETRQQPWLLFLRKPGESPTTSQPEGFKQRAKCVLGWIIELWDALVIFTCLSLSALRRGHKPSRRGSADVPADPDDDPASSGYEALPAVPHGDAPASSAQHEPLPQLQHGECDTKRDDATSTRTSLRSKQKTQTL